MAEKDVATMRKRQRILRLVLNGRIGEAVSSVDAEYPGLMDKNPDLLFRCGYQSSFKILIVKATPVGIG